MTSGNQHAAAIFQKLPHNYRTICSEFSNSKNNEVISHYVIAERCQSPAEWAGFENQCTRKGTRGSNPFLSAIFRVFEAIFDFILTCGEVSERLKEHAWKACIGLKLYRGFESPPLRQLEGEGRGQVAPATLPSFSRETSQLVVF